MGNKATGAAGEGNTVKSEKNSVSGSVREMILLWKSTGIYLTEYRKSSGIRRLRKF